MGRPVSLDSCGAACCTAVFCPVGAARGNHGRLGRVLCICSECNRSIVLHAIAIAAQANKVVKVKGAAGGLGNKVSNLVGVPSAASGTARKARHDLRADRGRDSFFGHSRGLLFCPLKIGIAASGFNRSHEKNYTWSPGVCPNLFCATLLQCRRLAPISKGKGRQWCRPLARSLCYDHRFHRRAI
jgi:hypothetical protein